MRQRHRTFWVMRRRFRQAQWLGSAAVLVVTAATLGKALVESPSPGPMLAVVLSVAAAALTWLVIGLMWRRYRHLHHEDWRQACGRAVDMPWDALPARVEPPTAERPRHPQHGPRVPEGAVAEAPTR